MGKHQFGSRIRKFSSVRQKLRKAVLDKAFVPTADLNDWVCTQFNCTDHLRLLHITNFKPELKN